MLSEVIALGIISGLIVQSSLLISWKQILFPAANIGYNATWQVSREVEQFRVFNNIGVKYKAFL